MEDVRSLIYSIIQFLRSQLDDNQSAAIRLSADGLESLEVAIQCLESAFNVQPNDPTLEVPMSLLEIFRGCSLVEAQDRIIPDKQASDAEKAEAEALKNEGNKLMKNNNFNEALDAYNKAIRIDGRNAVYYCNRAAAYQKLTNISASIQDCKMALRIDPSYGKAYGRLGLAYTTIEDHEKARECYQKAVELEPENEGFQNNLRLTLEKLSTPRTSSIQMPTGLDFGVLLNNPALMNMATQMMSNPGMQMMMNNIVAGHPPPIPSDTGVEALLQAGQQLAQQMSNSNPELIEQLRRQLGNGGGSGVPPEGGEGGI